MQLYGGKDTCLEEAMSIKGSKHWKHRASSCSVQVSLLLEATINQGPQIQGTQKFRDSENLSFWIFPPNLVELLQQKSIVYKQQNFISQSSGGWEVPDEVPAELVSGEGPCGHLPPGCILAGQRGRRALWSLSNKVTIPFMRALSSWLITSQRPQHLLLSHGGLDFNIWTGGNINVRCIIPPRLAG